MTYFDASALKHTQKKHNSMKLYENHLIMRSHDHERSLNTDARKQQRNLNKEACRSPGTFHNDNDYIFIIVLIKIKNTRLLLRPCVGRSPFLSGITRLLNARACGWDTNEKQVSVVESRSFSELCVKENIPMWKVFPKSSRAASDLTLKQKYTPFCFVFFGYKNLFFFNKKKKKSGCTLTLIICDDTTWYYLLCVWKSASSRIIRGQKIFTGIFFFHCYDLVYRAWIWYCE